jgi:hypothetical protein
MQRLIGFDVADQVSQDEAGPELERSQARIVRLPVDQRGGGWRSFKDARAFARGLKLKNGTEWLAYVKSGKRPHDIPAYPYDAYADAGWMGLGDWLGTERRRSG